MTQDPKDPPVEQEPTEAPERSEGRERNFPCINEDGEPEWFDSRLSPEEWKRPEDIAKHGDWVRQRGKPLGPRLRRLAYLLAYGKKNQDIAEELNMHPNWVSIMKGNSDVQAQVARYEERIFREDLQKRLDDAGEDAMNVMEEILRSPDIDVTKKEAAAKWVLEKLTGKATQPVEQTGKTSLNVFINQIREAKEAGQIIDVSPEGGASGGLLPERSDGPPAQEQREDNTYANWIEEEL